MSWIRYIDCMDKEKGLPSLKNKSIDLCLTDPPYNINLGTYSGYKADKRQKYIIKYEDNRTKKEYDQWCKLWFKEIQRISLNQMIFIGLNNIKFWYNNFDVFDMIAVYRNNAGYGSRIAIFAPFHPILCFGNYNQPLDRNLIKDTRNNGKFKEKYIHPHPKALNVIEEILKKLKPKSVIDPFMGSGTTAEACIKLGIKYYGYEMKEDYKIDIDKRIKRSTNYLKNKKNIKGLF